MDEFNNQGLPGAFAFNLIYLRTQPHSIRALFGALILGGDLVVVDMVGVLDVG